MPLRKSSERWSTSNPRTRNTKLKPSWPTEARHVTGSSWFNGRALALSRIRGNQRPTSTMDLSSGHTRHDFDGHICKGDTEQREGGEAATGARGPMVFEQEKKKKKTEQPRPERVITSLEAR